MDVLRELVSVTNVYINTRGAKFNPALLESLASWIGKMLRMFGLCNDDESEIGWGQGEQDQGNINVSPIVVPVGSIHRDCCLQREDVLMPYVRTLSAFRDGVRRAAMRKSDVALEEILALCDKLRDVDLVPLGVALDDQEGAYQS